MNSYNQTAETVEKRTNARYWIVVMLFIVTLFNYGDRATLSIAGSAMAKDIELDPVGLGFIFSAFSWAYVIGQMVTGPFWLKTGLLLEYFPLVDVYPVSGFC